MAWIKYVDSYRIQWEVVYCDESHEYLRLAKNSEKGRLFNCKSEWSFLEQELLSLEKIFIYIVLPPILTTWYHS